MNPVPHNKDLFNVEDMRQCKIKFEPPKHKRNITQSNTATFANDTAVVATDSDPAIASHKLQTDHLQQKTGLKIGEFKLSYPIFKGVGCILLRYNNR
jgi:hypothetical protein